MPKHRRRWSWVAVAVAVLAVGWAAQHNGHGSGSTGTPESGTSSAASPSAGTARPSQSPQADLTPTAAPDQNVPALFVAPVVSYARAAGVDPQLLMAILYNESYKPHDPAFQRAWLKLKPGAALGIANMHEAAFDGTKQGRDFADRSWQDLPDDPDLAIEAAAWYLHDLAAQLPARRSGACTEDELLALGYNTGASNMLAFARGVTPGSMAQSYLDRLHQNWATAGNEVKAGR